MWGVVVAVGVIVIVVVVKGDMGLRTLERGGEGLARALATLPVVDVSGGSAW